MEIVNQLLPVAVSFLLGLVVYLVKAVLDLSHRVLRLEVKLEILMDKLEGLECFTRESDKDDT
jgi:type III secretory pathway component EscS